MFGFSTEEKVTLLNDIAELVREDIPLKDIGEDFVKFGNANSRKLGESILGQVRKGKPVSHGLNKYFNPITLQALSSGESTQHFADGCINAARAIETTSGVRSKLLKAILPSLGMLLSILSILVVLADNIYPILSDVSPVHTWPQFAITFHNMVMGLKSNYILLMFIIIMTPILFSFTLRNLTGNIRTALDAFPIFTQYRYTVTAQMLFSLAVLLKSDVPLIESVQFLKKGASPYQLWKVQMILSKMQRSKGSSVAHLLDVGLLDERFMNRLKLLSRAGSGNARRLEVSALAHNNKFNYQLELVAKNTKTIVMAIGVISLLLFIGSIQIVAMTMTGQ